MSVTLLVIIIFNYNLIIMYNCHVKHDVLYYITYYIMQGAGTSKL